MTPGLVVVATPRDGDHLTLTGLRDPLAPDPAALLQGLPADLLTATWRPYAALEPVFVAARATRALHPPDGVQLLVDAGRLRITGAAPHAWIAEARRIAPAIAGVESLDLALTDTTEAQWPAAVAAVDAARVDFAVNHAEISDDTAARAALADLDRLADELARDVTVTLVAHRDAPATALDRTLQRARLLAVDAALRSASFASRRARRAASRAVCRIWRRASSSAGRTKIASLPSTSRIAAA